MRQAEQKGRGVVLKEKPECKNSGWNQINILSKRPENAIKKRLMTNKKTKTGQ